jgi:integrase
LRCAAKGGRRPVSFGYELLAAFLLTGGRESEVLRLEVDDVSLDRGAARLQTLDQGARVSV